MPYVNAFSNSWTQLNRYGTIDLYTFNDIEISSSYSQLLQETKSWPQTQFLLGCQLSSELSDLKHSHPTWLLIAQQGLSLTCLCGVLQIPDVVSLGQSLGCSFRTTFCLQWSEHPVYYLHLQFTIWDVLHCFVTALFNTQHCISIA